MIPSVTVWPMPSGITDGQHDVSDLDGVGVRKPDWLEVDGVDLQHREIARRVGSDGPWHRTSVRRVSSTVISLAPSTTW